jgi:integrase
LRHPEHLATIARIMAIPTKRHERNDLTYLTKPEIEALLNAPDQATWLGRRDYGLLLTMITTGVRVSELVAIKIGDVTLAAGAQHLRVHGKGRKNRTTPLKAETTAALRAWLRERAGAAEDPLFPARQGHPLHRQTVALLVTKHARAAAASCRSLATKRVSPHTLRHTNAMLIQAERIDIATIALWLGHESIKTTYIYQHANNQLKQEAIDRTATIDTPPGRYQPPDTLIAFLEGL